MADVHWKHRRGSDAQRFFATEAAGLAWIRVPGGPPVPEVMALTGGSIGLAEVRSGRPTPTAAQQFGRRLAVLHAAGAPSFGAGPPGPPGAPAPSAASGGPGPHGWIGDLPMPYAARATFRQLWAEDRIGATARMARDRGGLTPGQTREVDRFVEAVLAGSVDCGPAEPPARLHGDLWSGNLLWGQDGDVWLIDPAAHGGHRESDLAMLALFGTPFLDHVVAGYEEATPLAEGWRTRVPLHQVWPLLVHAALFAGGYGASAVAAIRRSGA